MKMITFKFKPLLFLILISCAFLNCSSDDDNPSATPPNNSGTNHTYDITVNGQRYNGEVDNVFGTEGENGAITAVSTYGHDNGKTIIGISLYNNDIWIAGTFEYPDGQDNNISLDSNSDSTLEFAPNRDIGYASQSGTAKVIVGQQLGMPPMSELDMEFDGIFSYTDDNGDLKTTNASGTISINLPPGY
ncbi:hypothetical protein [Bizionia myxarmorum]|nr:hypothetical protein [Bizionia myxarmorum]